MVKKKSFIGSATGFILKKFIVKTSNRLCKQLKIVRYIQTKTKLSKCQFLNQFSSMTHTLTMTWDLFTCKTLGSISSTLFWTPSPSVVNFINVKRTNFQYECRFGSLYYVHVTRKKFVQKTCAYYVNEIDRSRSTLMILAHGVWRKDLA